MKISKLFHWLYALLMLLPVFAMGVTCLYAIFNKNAYQSYYGDNVNEERLIQIASFDDIELSQRYTIFNETTLTYQQTGRITMFVNNVENNSDNRDLSQVNKIALYSNVWNNENHVYIVFYNGDTQVTNYDFLTYRVNVSFYLDSFSYENNTSYYLPLIYLIEYNKVSFLSEVFYYSVDRVKEAPMFNWAYNSFLAVPIVYITNLFSIPSTHIVVELLSYWLAISIIWLVFDLIMYVPLLVHRWIDKGVLE